MPIDFSGINLRNLFKPDITMDDTGTGVNDAPPNPQTDISNQLMKIYQPQMQSQQALNSAINTMPQRSNYQPSRLRQLAAIIAGMGTGGPSGHWGGQPVGYQANIPAAMAVQSAIKDQPFNEATQDWQRKIKPLEYQANLERENNVNQRQLASQSLLRANQAAQQKTREDDLQRKIEEGKAKEETNKGKLEVSQARAKAYIHKQMNPNHIMAENDKGELISFDPGSGSISIIADDDGNPIKSSKLPDADKIRLGVAGGLDKIRAAGDEARKLEAAKQNNRLNLKGMPAAPKPASNTAGTKTVSEVVIPGKESNFLGLGGREEQRKITTTTKVPNNAVPAAKPNTAPQNEPKTQVKVKSPSGVTGVIPIENLEKAKARGFVVIE